MLDMAAVIFLGGSTLFDIRNRKIPNGWLIFWVLLWAVLLIPLSGQPPQAILRFLGRTAGTLLLLFPLFHLLSKPQLQLLENILNLKFVFQPHLLFRNNSSFFYSSYFIINVLTNIFFVKILIFIHK